MLRRTQHIKLRLYDVGNWCNTIQILREKTRCRHMGYPFRLADSDLLREREMFYSSTHSTHFIYGYMASDIWLRTILIVREETRCRHIGYSFICTIPQTG